MHAGLSAGLRAALPGRDWSKRWQIYYKPGRSGQRAEGGRMIEEGGVPGLLMGSLPSGPSLPCQMLGALGVATSPPRRADLALQTSSHTWGCMQTAQPTRTRSSAPYTQGRCEGRSQRLRLAADTWRRCEARATSSSKLSIHAAASVSCARALLLLRPLTCFEKSLVADHTAAAAWRHAQHATQHVL